MKTFNQYIDEHLARGQNHAVPTLAAVSLCPSRVYVAKVRTEMSTGVVAQK